MRRKKEKPGYGKILDAWTPDEDSGDPIGCVATTFTFSPVLFEEECLGRFLNLETDANENGPAYLIEREEKLAQVSCASVLVDQHHIRGTRNLRWDLIPARVSRGIQHSKVSLLLWTNHARVIIASANVTDDGYRRNQEVFGVLDYFSDGNAPLQCLRDILEFLGECSRFASGSSSRQADPAVLRWNGFLSLVSEVAVDWGLDEDAARRLPLSPNILVTGPGRKSAFDGLGDLWTWGSPASYACVTSPFFDPPESPENRPAKNLWELLRARGEAQVDYLVNAEEIPGEDALFLHAPESLKKASPKNRSKARTVFHQLEIEGGRPLHCKSLYLANDRRALYLIGSSNFTSAGMGCGRVKNLEASLVYRTGRPNDSSSFDAIERTLLPSQEIPVDQDVRWEPTSIEGDDAPEADAILLHPAFAHATFRRDGRGRQFVDLFFNETPPQGWKIYHEDEERILADGKVRTLEPEERTMTMKWESERPPSAFRVTWQGAGGFAWWPVNTLNPASLPPPDDLRNLSLETLIEILTSAKPLHLAMARWLRKNSKEGGEVPKPLIDPHQRVDTSSFLLRRTKRISWAFRTLTEKLGEPLPSKRSLDWHLRGPVGALALAGAIEREASSPVEKSFLLTELALELARVAPQAANGCLSSEEAREGIMEVVLELKNRVGEPEDAPALTQYIENVFHSLAS